MDAGVASLAAAEARGQLPLVVDQVSLDGGEVWLTLSGDGWSFSTPSSWRLVRAGRFVCSSSDGPRRVAGELDGASLIDVAVRSGSVDDLTLAFAGGLVLEVFSDVLVEPWVLGLPVGVFVPSDVGQSSSTEARSAESLVAAVRGLVRGVGEARPELWDDPVVVFLRAVDSELDAWPVGDVRGRWSAEALEAADATSGPYVEDRRAEIERAMATLAGLLDPVELRLGRDAAVVLFEAVAAEALKASAGSAEAAALRELEAQLERTLVEPFRSDYAALVSAARGRLEDSGE